MNRVHTSFYKKPSGFYLKKNLPGFAIHVFAKSRLFNDFFAMYRVTHKEWMYFSELP